MEVLEFNLDLASAKVKIGERDYAIKEATSEAATDFRNASAGAAVYADGKMVRLEGIASVQPLLVSMCVFELKEIGGKLNECKVLMSQVKAWPDRVVKALFDKIKEISPSLREADEDDLVKQIDALQKVLKAVRDKRLESDAKNSPSATTDGSA